MNEYALTYSVIKLFFILFIGLFCTSSSAQANVSSLAFSRNICQLDEMAKPLYETQKAIKQYQLTNGVTVSLLQRQMSKTVSLTSHFNVGSANEMSGQTGYAHLFEHLLFKGSLNAPQDTYARELKAIGASFNASTHFDYTNYFARFPAEGTQLALFLDADRFITPTLTAESIENQQAAVLEEMASRIDNQPYIRKAMNFLLKQVEGTPYGHAVIGSKADIMQASLNDLTQFHQNYYRPDNLHLAMVGQIPEQTNSWIEAYFGNWSKLPKEQESTNEQHIESKTLADTINVTPASNYGEIIDERGPWPGLLLAWHTVPQHHTDAAAITLLERHLLQNKTSMLQQASLQNPDHLFSYSLPFPMARHGMANLILVPRARASLTQLAKGIEDLIIQAATKEVSAKALCQLKQAWLTSRLNLLNQEQALAQFLAASHRNESQLTAQWEQIKAVSQAEIKQVARQYFLGKAIRLDLLPPWYIRGVKAITETLPESWSDMLERAML